MIASFVFPNEKTRKGAHKLNGRSYAPFLNSIRERTPNALLSAPIAKGVRSPGVLGAYSESRGGVEGHAGLSPFKLDAPRRSLAGNGATKSSRYQSQPARLFSRDGLLPPSYVRRQLAGAVTGVRIFFSGLIGLKKNPPRTLTERLENIWSVVRLPLHVTNNGRRVSYEHPFRADNWSPNERTH